MAARASGLAVEPLLDPRGGSPDRRLRRTLRLGGAQPHHLARRSDRHLVTGGELGDCVNRAPADLVLGQPQLGHNGIRRR